MWNHNIKVLIDFPFIQSKCEVYWKKDLPTGFKVGRNITVTLNKSMGYADYEVNEITITNVRSIMY